MFQLGLLLNYFLLTCMYVKCFAGHLFIHSVGIIRREAAALITFDVFYPLLQREDVIYQTFDAKQSVS